MFIDTHCHLNILVKKTFEDFDALLTSEEIQQTDLIVKEAARAGVHKIVNVGTSLPESINCISLAQRYPSVYAAVGIHPNDLTDTWKTDIAKIEEYLQKKEEYKIVAIGECGVDKHYPGYNLHRQKGAFKRQIELALTYDLPLIIHSRDAAEETYQCLQEFKSPQLRGTIHCFSEDFQWAQEALSLGFVLGIGGTITYPRNEILRSAVKKVGIEKIILETDAPFLPPQFMRGKKNHPKFIKEIARSIADLLAIPVEEVERITTETAEKLFKI